MAVAGVQGLIARRLEGVELAAVARDLGAEVADALKGLLLLGRIQLLPGEGVVLVDGLLEGGERGGEGAEGGRGEGFAGGGACCWRGGGGGVGGGGKGL